MYFNAYQVYSGEVGTRVIKVDCDTNLNWTCSVNGNFGLNFYEGIGNTTLTPSENRLEITYFDDEEKDAYGEITFNYFENGCLKHVTTPIFYSEREKWLSIFPTTDVYTRGLTNEYKVFTIKTNVSKSNIDVETPGGENGNYDYFITNDLKLYLIKKTSINTKIKLLTSISKDSTITKGKITVVEMP